MKNFATFAFFFLFVALSPAFAGSQDFTLVNKAGFDIHSVFVSPHSTNEWEEDILGREVLENGQAVEIKFERSDKTKKWDLKVVDKEGKGYIWESLNLLEVSKVTVHYKDGNATATYE